MRCYAHDCLNSREFPLWAWIWGVLRAGPRWFVCPGHYTLFDAFDVDAGERSAPAAVVRSAP